MAQTQTIGLFGENTAAVFLQKKGYKILARNFHSKFGEIDIIALSPDKCTVFVEVKTRKSVSYGYPCEFVDKRKQQKLMKTAMFYTRTDDIDMRFDIIEVLYKADGEALIATHINHIENAF